MVRASARAGAGVKELSARRGILGGKRKPQNRTLKKVADALDMTVEHLKAYHALTEREEAAYRRGGGRGRLYAPESESYEELWATGRAGEVVHFAPTPLAEKLKLQRVYLKLLPQNVAEECRVRPGLVRAWEEAEQIPSLMQALDLARVLRFGLRNLLDYMGRDFGERYNPIGIWQPAADVEVAPAADSGAGILLYDIGGEFQYHWPSTGFPESRGTIPLPTAHTDAFAGLLWDNEMEPDLHGGDILLFSSSAQVRSGDIALVRLPDTALVRWVYLETDESSEFALLALGSPDYRRRFVQRSALQGLVKAVALFRKY